MPGYEDVTWFPLAAGLTALGVVAAFVAFRRRGAASGLRVLGWAVLPMAVYLAGLVRVLWNVGTEVGHWIGQLVFSPRVWTGLALLALSFFLLGGTRIMRRRRAGTTQGETEGAAPGKPAAADAQQRKAVEKGKPASDPLEGMDDIEEILKRRGIS